MRGFKPNHAMWKRVNAVIMGESLADVLTTFISAMGQMLIQAGVVDDETHARVHLAALLLSPDTSEKPGSLTPLLGAEFAKLDDNRWLQ